MKRALGLGLVAALLAACDPLATGSFEPPFLSIQGKIDGSTAAVMPRDVRVALLWQNDQTPGANYADQLVDVLAEFPAAFTVELKARPKAQVVDSLPSDTALGLGVDPAMRWSVATLIVYADGNENGLLDVVAPGDPPSPDTVLAAATDFDVWSLSAGKPAPADLIGIFPVAPAFSLVAEPPARDPEPGECGRFTPQGHFSDLCQPVLTADPALIDPSSFEQHLTLADDPRLGGYTCSAYWGPLDYPDILLDPTNVCDGGACKFCRGFQCPLDLPAPGDPVTCSPDHLAYVYKHCTDDAALCNTRICHYGHGELQAGDPVPAGWPCP